MQPNNLRQQFKSKPIIQCKLEYYGPPTLDKPSGTHGIGTFFIPSKNCSDWKELADYILIELKKRCISIWGEGELKYVFKAETEYQRSQMRDFNYYGNAANKSKPSTDA